VLCVLPGILIIHYDWDITCCKEVSVKHFESGVGTSDDALDRHQNAIASSPVFLEFVVFM
jgi:hypothetical protein